MEIKKSQMSEEEIKHNYITKELEKKGWDGKKDFRMEFKLTDGRINEKGERLENKRADYYLFHNSIPLAIIEAKKNTISSQSAIQQAINYANMIDCPFAFASNGDTVVEHDRLTGEQREFNLDQFPTKEELIERYKIEGQISNEEWDIVTLRNDYYQGYNTARYYQQVAINRAILEVAKGRQKMMIVMATGTGKTFVAYQIIHKLLKSKIKKRVLFIADMNILVDQTINNDFKSLKNKMIKIDSDILKSSEKLNSYEVYLGLYQQLMGKNGEKHYKKFNKNFFDLIIIDEAHRGSARDESTWREILEYFDSSTQIGLTATPKEDKIASNSSYFGIPIYTYSLKEGIDDGFLAPYRVIRPNIDIDIYGYKPEKGKIDVYGNVIEEKEFTIKDYDRKIIIDNRTQTVAKRVSDFLKETNSRFDKTIFFCVDIEHARMMRQALINENSDLVREDNRYVMTITGDSEDVEGRKELDNFADPNEKYPTLVTTSKLLSTGVNIKTCKLIVIDKNINSMAEFKQIIGRGTRLSEKHGKFYFTIIDFRGATDKFFDPEFDGKSLPYVCEPKTFIIKNKGKSIEEPIIICHPPRPEPSIENIKKYRVNDVDATVVNESVHILDPNGKLTTYNLIDYTKRNFLNEFADLQSFIKEWNDSEYKKEKLKELEGKGILFSELKEKYEEFKDMDEFDILLRIAYNRPKITRKDRAEKVKKSGLLEKYESKAREVLEKLIDRYKDLGIVEIEDVTTLKLEEFKDIGGAYQIVTKIFGGKQNYHQAIQSLSRQIYSSINI